MTEKLLIIIASGDREKVLTALMYAKNNIKYGWIPDVHVIFFGPSENLLTSDTDVNASAAELANYAKPIACKFLSDRDKISERIERMGIEVDYVGTVIADLLKDGYIPMVW
ncbi:DsrE family protein [Candidatus Thorarchaeota archaeon]|nr:MAG: DsrE family protein [Candidatus Thorarchaeota archaeon]